MASLDPNPEPQAPKPVSPAAAPVAPLPAAWQPFTARGVAAFSPASCTRLFLVALVVALLAAGVLVWFLSSAWVPTIRAAMRQLPQTGRIAGRQLQTPLPSLTTLAAGRFLGFGIDLDGNGEAAPGADLRIELHKRHVQVWSLFGCLEFAYPPGSIEFNRTDLEAWWGAWQPILLGMAALGTIAGLLLVWAVLATIYFVPVRVAAYFLDRQITLAGSWRLSVAALLPGALLLTFGIFCYGTGLVDLMRFLLIALFHLLLPWIYLAAALSALPRVVPPGTINPFMPAPAEAPEPKP